MINCRVCVKQQSLIHSSLSEIRLHCSTNFISIMTNSLATSVTPTVKIKTHLINRNGSLLRKVILAFNVVVNDGIHIYY